eukprot:3670117-Rhodomonas_salina.2
MYMWYGGNWRWYELLFMAGTESVGLVLKPWPWYWESVALILSAARGYGPVKLLFGLGLLFNGTAFAHLILFTHAFNISGYSPILRLTGV